MYKTNQIIISLCLLFIIISCVKKYDLVAESRSPIMDIINNIEKSEDVNKKSIYGETALKIASEYGNINVVKKLIIKGANVDEKDSTGVTALMIASREGHLNVVMELLKNGADVNSRHVCGYTPLIYAVKNNHFDVASELILKGADVNLEIHNTKDQNGATAYWFISDNIKDPIEYKKYDKIRNLLVSSGAKTKINILNSDQIAQKNTEEKEKNMLLRIKNMKNINLLQPGMSCLNVDKLIGPLSEHCNLLLTFSGLKEYKCVEIYKSEDDIFIEYILIFDNDKKIKSWKIKNDFRDRQ